MSVLKFVKVPKNLQHPGPTWFQRRLNSLPIQKKYVIDFSELENLPPFGALYTSILIKQFIQKRKQIHMEMDKPEAEISFLGREKSPMYSYANKLGFFNVFDPGFSPNLEPQQKVSFRPIKQVIIKNLKKRASSGLIEVGDVLVKDSEDLALALTQNVENNLFETLSYSILEMFRNVVEHSGAESIWYSVQTKPTQDVVEIAIMDEGNGIRKTLSSNPTLSGVIQDDLHALELSLCPGISRNIRLKGKQPTQINPPSGPGWENIGHGLYNVCQISGKSSGFLILSGTAGISISRGEKPVILENLPLWSGTAIRIRIRTSQLPNLEGEQRSLQARAREEMKLENVLQKGGALNWLFPSFS